MSEPKEPKDDAYRAAMSRGGGDDPRSAVVTGQDGRPLATATPVEAGLPSGAREADLRKRTGLPDLQARDGPSGRLFLVVEREIGGRHQSKSVAVSPEPSEVEIREAIEAFRDWERDVGGGAP